MHLHHVALAVKDMERSLSFYRDALGLALFEDAVISGPEVDAALMEANAEVRMVLLADQAGTMIELLGWHSPLPRPRPAEHRGFTSIGLVKVSLVVNDLETAGKKLKEAGFGFRTPLWRFGRNLPPYGGGEAWIRYVEDPDGVHVELMQIVEPASA